VRPCGTVTNSAGAFLNTLSGVSIALRPGLVVAASIYGPPSVGRENFPDPRVVAPLTSAPQRYSLISEDNLVLFPGLSAGWRALAWLDVGATIQVRYFRARQVQTIYSLGGVGGEVTDLDAVAGADATDPARLVLGLGAIVRPLPGLSIGLSARPGSAVHAAGTLDVQLPSFATAAGATVTGREMHVDFEMAPEARLGARYDRGPVSIFFDLTWENWGVLNGMTVTPTDIVIHQGGADTQVGPIAIPRRWHAAWTGRLGAEYEISSELKIRAGALYEKRAIPDETLQIDFASLDRLGATAGVTWRWRALEVTAGLAHFFSSSRTVTSSQVTRIDPYPAPSFTIGNGEYASSLDALAVQLAVTL
ncbi:MAG: outer membrane protein transport protein, partial [Myxococcales bacterium]|nr:outer membrane protein transport protein [Myxococcales bacterium]